MPTAQAKTRFVMLAATVAAAAALVAASPVLAQASASAQATASITIVRGLTIAKDRDLAFGLCLQPPFPGAVTVQLDGSRIVGGMTCLPSLFNAAQFTMTGEGAAAITVTFPGAVNMVNGGNSIPLTLFSNAPGNLGGVPGADGTSVFQLGGTAQVGGLQPTGTYSATITVSVAYQ